MSKISFSGDICTEYNPKWDGVRKTALVLTTKATAVGNCGKAWRGDMDTDLCRHGVGAHFPAHVAELSPNRNRVSAGEREKAGKTPGFLFPEHRVVCLHVELQKKEKMLPNTVTHTLTHTQVSFPLSLEKQLLAWDD